MTYLSSSHNWLVVLTAVVIVGLCVVLHYEVLSLSNRYLPALSRRRRPRVLILIGVVCRSDHGPRHDHVVRLIYVLRDVARLVSALATHAPVVMITWSASYTFFEMQRDWSPR